MLDFNPSLPKRIVCLTEETTETLYKLGADDRIVGITAYTVRPPEAKLTKAIIARYIDAEIDEIIKLKPDVVFAWSDLQSKIAEVLIRNGIEVFAFNHRSIEGILGMILKVGAIVGKNQEAENLVGQYLSKIKNLSNRTQNYQSKPIVYFEEWYNPLITGICWVSEIIELCGGIDPFSHHREFFDAKRRILESTDIIIEKNPDIIIASWCGKPFKRERMLKRKGWAEINAIQNDEIHEIDSAIILQPGPAALTDGIDIIDSIISNYLNRRSK
jgi:iron complex transport system substrate-binding protein